MLNKTETVSAAVSFTDELKELSLEALREKESFLIDEILRHYDELENLVQAVLEDKQENPDKEIPLSKYECSIGLINNRLNTDSFKLSQIKTEIKRRFQTELLSAFEYQEQDIIKHRS